VFTGRGHPVHERGVTRVPGLYFIGRPWLHTWGSGRFSGVARDAHVIAERIAHHRAHQAEGDACRDFRLLFLEKSAPGSCS